MNKKHGGKRPNAGRPAEDPFWRKQQRSISLPGFMWERIDLMIEQSNGKMDLSTAVAEALAHRHNKLALRASYRKSFGVIATPTMYPELLGHFVQVSQDGPDSSEPGTIAVRILDEATEEEPNPWWIRNPTDHPDNDKKWVMFRVSALTNGHATFTWEEARRIQSELLVPPATNEVHNDD